MVSAFRRHTDKLSWVKLCSDKAISSLCCTYNNKIIIMINYVIPPSSSPLIWPGTGFFSIIFFVWFMEFLTYFFSLLFFSLQVFTQIKQSRWRRGGRTRFWGRPHSLWTDSAWSWFLWTSCYKCKSSKPKSAINEEWKSFINFFLFFLSFLLLLHITG